MELTTIQLLWFCIVAVLWIGYLALEGFDFGVAMLLKILAKSPKERRVVLSTIGPHWDGNEVWVLTAGGATFAAFPEWYATMFSGMYLALMLILVCLIVRVCAIEWRKMIDTDRWRNGWDTAHTVSAWIVSILWGVAFANLVQGMHIEIGHYEKGAFVPVAPHMAETSLADNYHYLTGGFFSLITPFTVLGGLVTLGLFLSHGAIFLTLKTTGDLRARAHAFAKKSIVFSTSITAVWALWAQFAHTNNAISILPLALCALSLITAAVFVYKDREGAAFIAHFVAIGLAVVFIWFTIFPDAMKSSVDSRYSLTLAQAAATGNTQIIMSFAALIFVPIVLGYTVWSYRIFSRRISVEHIPEATPGLDPKNVRSFENA